MEDSGLIVWLALLRASILVMGFPVAALVLLLVLLVEHSIMQRAENPKFTGKIFLEILALRCWKLSIGPYGWPSFQSMISSHQRTSSSRSTLNIRLPKTCSLNSLISSLETPELRLQRA